MNLPFSNAEIYYSMTSEISYPVRKIVCDGGVTANDFVMQLTADLIGINVILPLIFLSREANLRSVFYKGKTIQRMCKTDMSALGAAFMAGRAVNFWKSDEELVVCFLPSSEVPNSEQHYQ